MTILIEILTLLSSLHPLALLVLLMLVLYAQQAHHRVVTRSFDSLAHNHLSDMPEVLTTLREISTTLRRMEERQIGAIATVLERLKA